MLHVYNEKPRAVAATLKVGLRLRQLIKGQAFGKHQTFQIYLKQFMVERDRTHSDDKALKMRRYLIFVSNVRPLALSARVLDASSEHCTRNSEKAPPSHPQPSPKIIECPKEEHLEITEAKTKCHDEIPCLVPEKLSLAGTAEQSCLVLSSRWEVLSYRLRRPTCYRLILNEFMKSGAFDMACSNSANARSLSSSRSASFRMFSTSCLIS